MKKNQNIADAITVSRIIAAIIAPFLSLPEACAVYIYGMFSDGIDGCFADANKQKRWYDRLPITFDELADLIFWVSCLYYSLFKTDTALRTPVIIISTLSIITAIISRPIGKRWTTAVNTIFAISVAGTWWIVCLSLIIDFGGWRNNLLIPTFLLATFAFLVFRYHIKQKTDGKNPFIFIRKPNR